VNDIDGFSRYGRQILRTRIDEFFMFGHNLVNTWVWAIG
jgi:hypothetical protein